MNYIESTLSDDWRPTLEIAQQINAEAAALLPSNYSGTNSSKFYAEAFLNRLLEVGSWEAMFAYSPQLPPYGMVENTALTYHRLSELVLPQSSPIVYFDFLTLFQVEYLSPEQIGYALYLTSYYKERTNQGILGMLEAVYQNQYGFLARGTFVTAEQIEKYISMSRWLRNEGITAHIATTWMISQAWQPEDLIETLSEGIGMTKLTELLSIGFREPQEIIDYLSSDSQIPDSWMKHWLS